MSSLFNRHWSIQIGNTLIRNREDENPLSIVFGIEKTNKRQPNKASLEILNLSPERRRGFTSGDQIEIIAGYKDLNGTVFLGNADNIYSGVEENDVVTSIEAKDGGGEYRNATFSQSYNAGISVYTALFDCLEAMGIGSGNLPANQGNIKLANNATTFIEGMSFSGLARRTVDRIVTASGFRWSIQDGTFQLRSGSEPTDSLALVLSPSTGLLGSPKRQFGRRLTDPVKVTCRSNLLPSLYPGKLIELDSAEVSGNYSVAIVKHTGSTIGKEWYSDLVLEEY